MRHPLIVAKTMTCGRSPGKDCGLGVAAREHNSLGPITSLVSGPD